MTEKSLKRRNKEKTKDLILQVATELINENGYDKLSTNHIADQAKVAIGTVYHHFPKGKVDIVYEITLRNFDKIVNFDLFGDLNESNFKEYLLNFVKNHVKAHREDLKINLAYEQAFLSDRQSFDSHMSLIEEKLMVLTNIIHNLNIFKHVSKKDLFTKLRTSFILLDSMVHYHLFFTPILNTDEELVVYLSKLILNTLTIN